MNASLFGVYGCSIVVHNDGYIDVGMGEYYV